MNEQELTHTTIALLRDAGHPVSDPHGRVTLSAQELASLLSQHTVAVVQQFVRLQRQAGVQTVHYASVPPDSFRALTDRMLDHGLLLNDDQERAMRVLREGVVDIRPLVDERLFSLCNQHRTLAGLGLAGESPGR